MSNRRDYERLLIRRFALLKLANGEIIKGETRNMSMGGAFIECEPGVDVAEGTACTIQLLLNDGDKEVSTEISGSISHSHGGGLGCDFLRINNTYYQFIRELYT